MMTLSGNITLSSEPADHLAVLGNGSGFISGNIAGASQFTHSSSGTGTWALAGTNTYTGLTNINGGNLHFVNRVSLYNADTTKWNSANLKVYDGGGVVLSVGGASKFTIDEFKQYITSTEIITEPNSRMGLDISNAPGAAYNYTEVLSDNGVTARGFVKRGAGVLTLSANNTYSGVTNAEGGTLVLSGNNSYAGVTNVNGGILRLEHANALGTTSAGVVVTGGTASQLQLTGGLTIAGESLTLSSDALNTLGAVLNVSGNNFWTGNVTINSSSTAGIVPRIAAEAGTKLTFSGSVNLASGQAILAQGDGTIEYTGAISGPGNLGKNSTGSGTLIVSGTNTYTGLTQISGGTVLVNNNSPNGAAGAFGNATSPLTITASSSQAPQLLINGAYTIGRNINASSSGSGTILNVILGGNAAVTSAITGNISFVSPLTLSQIADGRINIGGNMTGSAAVTITGEGSVNFNNAAKAYTGTTTVNSLAKLLVNTTVASPTVTVSGTLGGSGTLSGAVNFSATGILAPGNSAGTLSTGALSFNNLSSLNYELGTPNVVGAGFNDLTSVTGTLALDGVLNVTALAGFGEGTYRLFDYTAGPLVDGTLSIGTLPSGYLAVVDTSVPNQVNLIVTSAIPEPSTFVLGGIGLLGFALIRRRRIS